MHAAAATFALFLLATCASGCREAEEHMSGKDPAPPRAPQHPHRLEEHGRVRLDPYYWLKERDNPEVLAYLQAENDYTGAMTAHLEPLRERLFLEIKGRIRETDISAPYRWKRYWYYTRFEEGREYPLHCRKRGSLEAAEEVLLDLNRRAEGHGFYALTGQAVSPGEDLLAFAEDTVGRRISTIRFRRLDDGSLLKDSLEQATGNLAWAADNRTVFYTRQHPETLRSWQVWRHRLGEDPSRDALVYQEDDETFQVGVTKSRSERYLLIGSFQTVTNEYRYLAADQPEGAFRVFLPRERGHEYDLEHYQGKFFIRTNQDGAENFKLMTTPEEAPGREHWRELIGHREQVLLEGFELFERWLVTQEREQGLVRLRVLPWEGGEGHDLDFGEPAYAAGLGTNPEPATDRLRYVYSSLTTPRSVYDYDMGSRERELLKRDEVLGDFDPARYRTERLLATAPDGRQVPISLVYRPELRREEANPLLLFGYGAYGYSLDAAFSSARLSLLDRGFIYAIAHVRGGQELGRWWYDEGRLLNKKNTFTDFIACAEHLVARGYTVPERLYAMGGSAGGLLMGAVVNLRPELFHGVVAQVPFVDVVTTMLDPEIPLTTGEYDEWGDPGDSAYYDYIRSYSPYDNLRAGTYPHLLVTTGLHDSQVQYWEPAKWVARLRELKSGDHLLLLKTNLEAGHGGPSGRFRTYREIAFIYSFLLELAGEAGERSE